TLTKSSSAASSTCGISGLYAGGMASWIKVLTFANCSRLAGTLSVAMIASSGKGADGLVARGVDGKHGAEPRNLENFRHHRLHGAKRQRRRGGLARLDHRQNDPQPCRTDVLDAAKIHHDPF